jgi:hypothetical protein
MISSMAETPLRMIAAQCSATDDRLQSVERLDRRGISPTRELRTRSLDMSRDT